MKDADDYETVTRGTVVTSSCFQLHLVTLGAHTRTMVSQSSKGSTAALTNASGMLTCRVLADALSIAFFFVVSRLLGPEGIGTYSYGFALAAFVYAACSLGIEQYGVREYQHAGAAQRIWILTRVLALQLIVATLAICALTLFLWITNASLETSAISYELSTYQICSALAATLFVPALANEDMLRPSLSALFTRGVAFAIAALVLLFDVGPLSVALLAFPLLSLVYVTIAVRSAWARLGRFRLSFALAPIMETARALRSFATVDVLGQLLAKMGVVVLMLNAGERAAGIYATGMKFVELGFLPLWFLGVALYPRLCVAHLAAPAEFSRLARTLLITTAAMTIAVALVLLLAMPPLLVPVLGSGYEGTQRDMATVAAIAVLYGFEIALGRVLFAQGRHHERALGMSVGILLLVLLSLLTASRWGVIGVIAATAVAYLVIDGWYAAEASGKATNGQRSRARLSASDRDRTDCSRVPIDGRADG